MATRRAPDRIIWHELSDEQRELLRDQLKGKGGPKPGPKKGSHWKHRSDRVAPESMNWPSRPGEMYPGPFTPRTDYPELVRPALWVNCALCGALFARSIAEIRTRATGRQAKHLVCSISCGAQLRAEPRFRVCNYCSRAFKVTASSPKRKSCCDECMRMVQSESHKVIKRTNLVYYAFEHGIKADPMELKCDYCGVGNKTTGKDKTKNPHYYVRITEVEGKIVARCKRCYEIQVAIPRKKLTAGDKTRLREAKQLIDRFVLI